MLIPLEKDYHTMKQRHPATGMMMMLFQPCLAVLWHQLHLAMMKYVNKFISKSFDANLCTCVSLDLLLECHCFNSFPGFVILCILNLYESQKMTLSHYSKSMSIRPKMFGGLVLDPSWSQSTKLGQNRAGSAPATVQFDLESPCCFSQAECGNPTGEGLSHDEIATSSNRDDDDAVSTLPCSSVARAASCYDKVG